VRGLNPTDETVVIESKMSTSHRVQASLQINAHHDLKTVGLKVRTEYPLCQLLEALKGIRQGETVVQSLPITLPRA
jgi:hypothetical protein